MITAFYHQLRQMLKLKVASKEKMLACLSGESCNIDALWFKVARTPVSPIKIETVKMLYFLCVLFLWDVTSLSLSRISSFKRSWEFVTGQYLSIRLVSNLKHEIKYWRSSQTEFSLKKHLNLVTWYLKKQKQNNYLLNQTSLFYFLSSTDTQIPLPHPPILRQIFTFLTIFTLLCLPCSHH